MSPCLFVLPRYKLRQSAKEWLRVSVTILGEGTVVKVPALGMKPKVQTSRVVLAVL